MRNRLVFLLGLLLCFPTFLLAQVVITSSIVGTVTDPAKAVVPGASVALTNTDTGVQWNATTNSSGDYQFPLSLPGITRSALRRKDLPRPCPRR